MSAVSKSVICFISACILLFGAFFFRVVPSARIWPDYQVVYFSNTEDLSFLAESTVMDLFPGVISSVTAIRSIESEVPDFSTSDQVYRGSIISSGIPAVPFYRDGYTSDSIRSFFFTDKDGGYQLVYVPDSQFKQFCSLLNSKKIPYGTDSTVKLPYAGGFVILALILILCIIVRPPLLHAVIFVPIATCTFLAPWVTANCAVCAFLGLLPFIQRYWNRVQGTVLFFRNLICIALLAVVSGMLVLTPVHPLCVTLLCLLSSVLFGASIRYQEAWAKKTRHFTFTPILSGNFVQVADNQKIGTVIVYSLAVLVLSGLSLFSTVGGTVTDTSALSLPGPTVYTEDITTVDGWTQFSDFQELSHYPDITDYVSELWVRQAAAFHHINEVESPLPQKDSIVSVSHFYEDTDGVHETKKDVLVFDDVYLNKSVPWLLEHDTVAAFLLHQGVPSTITYTTTGSFSLSVTDYIGLGVSVAMAACLSVMLMIKSARKRSSETA